MPRTVRTGAVANTLAAWAVGQQEARHFISLSHPSLPIGAPLGDRFGYRLFVACLRRHSGHLQESAPGVAFRHPGAY